MALLIDNPEVEELARELAKQTGESVERAIATAIREWFGRNAYSRGAGTSQALGASPPGSQAVRDPVVEAIRERMLRQPRPDPESTRIAIREIQEHIAKLPVLDSRTPDELLGYDEFGLPH
ncbi:MAG: type II toxin-antitoxin system VapB family antitoxin [Bryobacteraceae bacterium]